MAWASKDSFFGAKVPFEQMEIPDVGHIKVYGLTSGEKDAYENAVVRLEGKERNVKLANARAKLLIMTVRDNQGRPLFTDADMGRINNIPAQIVDPIMDVARRLSGMAGTEVEDLVKNSQQAQEQTQNDLRSD